MLRKLLLLAILLVSSQQINFFDYQQVKAIDLRFDFGKCLQGVEDFMADLVSVKDEIEYIQKHPPQSQDEAQKDVEELSARIKKAIADVQELIQVDCKYALKTEQLLQRLEALKTLKYSLKFNFDHCLQAIEKLAVNIEAFYKEIQHIEQNPPMTQQEAQADILKLSTLIKGLIQEVEDLIKVECKYKSDIVQSFRLKTTQDVRVQGKQVESILVQSSYKFEYLKCVEGLKKLFQALLSVKEEVQYIQNNPPQNQADQQKDIQELTKRVQALISDVKEVLQVDCKCKHSIKFQLLKKLLLIQQQLDLLASANIDLKFNFDHCLKSIMRSVEDIDQIKYQIEYIQTHPMTTAQAVNVQLNQSTIQQLNYIKNIQDQKAGRINKSKLTFNFIKCQKAIVQFVNDLKEIKEEIKKIQNNPPKSQEEMEKDIQEMTKKIQATISEVQEIVTVDCKFNKKQIEIMECIENSLQKNNIFDIAKCY